MDLIHGLDARVLDLNLTVSEHAVSQPHMLLKLRKHAEGAPLHMQLASLGCILGVGGICLLTHIKEQGDGALPHEPVCLYITGWSTC